VSVIASAKEAVYGLHQDAWSAWARRRFKEDFDRVERFCLFVGYPRSGHSIVGAMLNAHRDAVISHELDAPPLILAGCSRDELYSRILARAYWFNLRGNRANYPYQVPGQWQGRFDMLRLVGDKRGGIVTRSIAEHPDFLKRVRSLIGVPLRLIHVVRNPFDNISAISIWGHRPLADSAEYYLRHCRTTARLDEVCEPGEVITIHHEEMIRDPAATLPGLLEFLHLEPYPGYVEDCARVVFSQPTRSRRAVTWPAGLARDVEKRIRPYPFLKDYSFEVDAAAGS
jgi:hypothetical protein